MKRTIRSVSLFAVALLALAPHANATIMLQLDLAELTERAGTIFRGTVISVETGAVAAGGGSLPTITYRFVVNDLIKGEPTHLKGDNAIVEIQVIGSLKPSMADGNGVIRLDAFRDVPRFKIGGDYLLFATSPSSIGLSTTVGLGQGAFKVFAANGGMAAVNEFNNAGLGLNGDGPIAYSVLSAKINALLGQ
jgi:hypothetical protein